MRTGRKSLLIKRLLLAATIVAGFLLGPGQPAEAAFQIDIHGPVGSGEFGTTVTVLPNGNFLVTDPYFDSVEAVDIGVVYMYDGASGEQISMLTGSTSNDRIASDGVTLLNNGNYLVSSRYWDDSRGAVTWVNGNSRINGLVSAFNSLVGSTINDQVGSGGVTSLSNGNYVVSSPYWDNGTITNAGAVTWGNGNSGVTGEISSLNSLIGTSAGDRVGDAGQEFDGVISLSNGNYLVNSHYWNNDSGAFTWGSGTGGITGEISTLNSLVGITFEWVDCCRGSITWLTGGVTLLSNGNYVVYSYTWNNEAGAAVWGDGNSGVSGEVSSFNSLVGSSPYLRVGAGVVPLSNGNYVVISENAITWGEGTTGISGEVSELNSLVGSSFGPFDVGGIHGAVTPLSNGNYVVSSQYWEYGLGAVIWVDGNSGVTGQITAFDRLVGSKADDRVGYFVTPLSNGNYVVGSPYWDNGAVTDAGAVTWRDGNSGVAGVVSAQNSLVGRMANDRVGYDVTPLSNGNYVVSSPYWDNGAVPDIGAGSWGSGTNGVFGEVSASSSLVGRSGNDLISLRYIDKDRPGGKSVIPLSNGNYVVISSKYRTGPGMDVGAVTWVDGSSGVSGVVSDLNSLIGNNHDDGSSINVFELSDGSYVVYSPSFDDTPIVPNVGAVTWSYGASGITGPTTSANSVIGTAAFGGSSMNFQYDSVNDQLVVGRPADNIVTLFKKFGQQQWLPIVVR